MVSWLLLTGEMVTDMFLAGPRDINRQFNPFPGLSPEVLQVEFQQIGPQHFHLHLVHTQAVVRAVETHDAVRHVKGVEHRHVARPQEARDLRVVTPHALVALLRDPGSLQQARRMRGGPQHPGIGEVCQLLQHGAQDLLLRLGGPEVVVDSRADEDEAARDVG